MKSIIPDRFEPGPDFAAYLDSIDDLRSFRTQFVIPDPDLIYLDGNSLGRLSVRTRARIMDLVNREWGDALIRSWGETWLEAPVRIGEKIARLVGAAPGQVIVSDSTSVNLFKLVLAVLSVHPERTKIITDDFNFPSDLYILQGCLRLAGNRHQLVVIPSQDSILPDLAALYDAIDSSTALVTLSHVAFKSGYLYNAFEITRKAHAAGALVLWDLSHSAGVVPVDLDQWEADLAVGCTYKYLNGGPGAPAFLYVRKSLQEEILSPVWGWFGDHKPFNFDLAYVPSPGVNRFLAGTPPILSLQAVEPGADLLLEAGLENIRNKSIQLSSYLVYLYDLSLAPAGFALGSPRQAERRGSHISIRHPEGYRINRALIEELKVLPDFREPDHIRLGLAPLYNSFRDVFEAVIRLQAAVEEKRYLHYPITRMPVT